jgi:hypothetical protein
VIKLLALFLLTIMNLEVAHAAFIRLSPVDKSEISNGDLIEVQIEADENINWKQLEMKKIGDIFHILKIESNAEGIGLARAMVAPPNNPKYDGKLKIGSKTYEVQIVGFKPNWVQQQPMKDFLVMPTMHKLKKDIKTILALVGVVFMGLVIIFRKKSKCI